MTKRKSRKGLSLEEKRKRMENYLHETSDFFQLKELEKIGPKKGVVAQSVKDVIQSLVDDGLVMTDKIATSNYYWSYPGTAANAKRRKLEELQEAVQGERDKKQQLHKAMVEAGSGREPSNERDDMLQKLKQEQEAQKKLLTDLQQYSDPETYRIKKKATVIARDAANRWTENIWTLESYCVNKFNMDRRDFEKSFGIDSEFDTLP
ncbi:meiotic nuclear division protein 1 [Fennellomyces sp. T-0311]|nr:meiotic nuclear division protein 1 [Fennellomyces sp. T-0311]